MCRRGQLHKQRHNRYALIFRSTKTATFQGAASALVLNFGEPVIIT
jgi:hypothetical protein